MSHSSNTVHHFGKAIVTSMVAQSSVANVDSVTVASYITNMQDSGNTLVLNSTSGTTVTLPTVTSAEGFQLNIFIGATAASHVIAAPTASIIGMYSVTGTGANLQSLVSARTSMTVASAVSTVGDNFSIFSDGVRFYLSGMAATSTGSAVLTLA